MTSSLPGITHRASWHHPSVSIPLPTLEHNTKAQHAEVMAALARLTAGIPPAPPTRKAKRPGEPLDKKDGSLPDMEDGEGVLG